MKLLWRERRLLIFTAAVNFSCLISATAPLYLQKITDSKAQTLLKQFGYLEDEKISSKQPRSASLASLSFPAAFPSATFPSAAIPSPSFPSNLTSPYQNALINFQKFYHLPITGKLDDETKTILTRPRCGTSDKLPQHLVDIGRSRRYVTGSVSWFDHGFKNPITFGLKNTAEPILSRKNTCIAILRAFRMWEQQSKIRFQEVNYRLCEMTCERNFI